MIQYINLHLANNNFSDIEEISKEIIDYKQKIKELTNQLRKNKKEEIDLQREENTKKYK